VNQIVFSSILFRAGGFRRGRSLRRRGFDQHHSAQLGPYGSVPVVRDDLATRSQSVSTACHGFAAVGARRPARRYSSSLLLRCRPLFKTDLHGTLRRWRPCFIGAPDRATRLHCSSSWAGVGRPAGCELRSAIDAACQQRHFAASSAPARTHSNRAAKRRRHR